MATRWGICSTGLIANDFVTALKHLPHTQHQVVAVAAMSDKQKAVVFADKYDIPTAYGTYQELAQDTNVEIVYIGSQTQFHYEACLLFLEHGKHVLCEKPMTLTLKEAEEVMAKARQKKLFLMEGWWTRFFPAYRAVVKELESGSLGDVHCIQATLAINNADIIGEDMGAMGRNVVRGLACYPLMYIQQVFKGKPEKIQAVGQFDREGGDVGAALTLQYTDGQVAQVYVHLNLAMGASTVTFHGTKGNLQVHDPVPTPTRVTFPGACDKPELVFPLPETKEKFNWWNTIGFVYEAQAVRDCLMKGLTECEAVRHEDSIIVADIIQNVCDQLGINFV